jgi:hypothetical protein
MRLAYLLIALAACADTTKGPEDDVPTDGKLDSFQKPTDHGAIAFGAPQTGHLASDAKYHAWTFVLGTGAEIHAYTQRTPHKASVDTVLYLYQKQPNGGWGSYIARNDDDGTSEWSSIDKTLGLGQYRLLVKGYSASTTGYFDLNVACTGAGCSAPCLFGGSLGDLEGNAGFTLGTTQRLYSPANLSALQTQQIVLAMQESAHTDVTTVYEAFDAADQNEIDLTTLTHVASGRTFQIVDYGAGDNTYGAIFTDGTTDIATAIHDSDFYRCAVN